MLNVFMVALIAHMICEFILMPDFLFVGKGNTLQGAILHLMSVTIVTFGMIYYFFGGDSWPLVLIICGCHVVIDLLKPIFLRRVSSYNMIYFMFDQLAHILILVVAAQIAAKNTPPLEEATVTFIEFGTLLLIGVGLAPMFARIAARSLFPKLYKNRGVMMLDEVFCDALLGIATIVLLKMVSVTWITVAGLFVVWILYTVISWGLARLIPLTAMVKGLIAMPIIFAFTKFLV